LDSPPEPSGCKPFTVFHVELRKFPNVARALNLTSSELHEQIVGPWIRDQTVELEDRHWLPSQTKLTIYEGPELRPDQIGIGRGWGNATRSGTEVTGRVLADARQEANAPIAALRDELLARCAGHRVSVEELVAMVNDRFAAMRVSDRLALAEQCVWELLHHGRLQLLVNAAQPTVVAPEQWELILLTWETWTDPDAGVSLAGIDPVEHH
jgi:hypothetical protein